jgi:hypothetical protein
MLWVCQASMLVSMQKKVQLENTSHTSYQLFSSWRRAPLYYVQVFQLIGTTRVVHITHLHAHVRNVCV